MSAHSWKKRLQDSPPSRRSRETEGLDRNLWRSVRNDQSHRVPTYNFVAELKWYAELFPNKHLPSAIAQAIPLVVPNLSLDLCATGFASASLGETNQKIQL